MVRAEGWASAVVRSFVIVVWWQWRALGKGRGTRVPVERGSDAAMRKEVGSGRHMHSMKPFDRWGGGCV